jgi:hypothetical protein
MFHPKNLKGIDMNELIASIGDFYKNNGIEATKEQVVSSLILGLKEAFGLTNKEAFDVVFGEGRYDAMIGDLWTKFAEANKI